MRHRLSTRGQIMSLSNETVSISDRDRSARSNASLVYNVPTALVDRYRGCKLILRSSSPTELVDSLSRVEPESIRFIQLLSTDEDASVLEGFRVSLPLEIVLSKPAEHYLRLYNYKSLLDTHPIRVAVPVVPQFSNAVKVALSLNFAVKLELDQPDDQLVNELESVLDIYLHRSFVAHPVEPFHSLLQSFYGKQPVSLWQLAEEDTNVVRYIADDDTETISRRSIRLDLNGDLENFVDHFGQEVIDGRLECHDCEFFSRCGGYFKFPNKLFKCDGIKRVLRTLAATAEEVKDDLERFETMEAQTQS
jgi:sulfatase maturation enzyme AslB (radical SAM superfamily)